MRVTSLLDSSCSPEPVSHTADEEGCTGSLYVEVFDDSNKVGADVVLLRGCPQSCIPNLVEGLLEVYENIVKVLLVLEIFLTEDSEVEDLLCGAPSCSKASLVFSDDLH